MSLFAALPAAPAVLPTLRSDAPFRTPPAVEGVSEPLVELVIPPADGKVLRPGDAGFNDALPFNLRTAAHPLAVAQCLTANGVSLAIRWARRHQIPLCAHAGGHSYEGFSSCAGLVVDVRKMDSITIDTASQTARLGAGCLLGNVAETLFEKKFVLPSGSCRPVGVCGLTLGGGHGMTARKFGLTCDSLLSAHVVTADGSIVEASANENPDLFWALRGGGGGNFGIVTEFTFKVHPVDRVIAFTIKWPDTSLHTAVIKAWQNFAKAAPDELSFLLHVNGGQGQINHLACNGLYLPRQASQTPDLGELKKLLGPLLSLGKPGFYPHEFSYLDSAKLFSGDGDHDRVFFKGKSDYAQEVWSDEILQTFVAAVRACASPVSTIFEAYGGAIGRVGAADTAFPHRGDTLFCLQYFLQWPSSAATNHNVASLRTLYAAMRAHLPGYSYVNYLDADLQDFARAYYKGNLSRLQAVKQQYDPDNFFHFAQSIPLPGETDSTHLA